MSPLKWIMKAVLVLPLMELAVFIAVALQIGVLAAFALTLATSLLGIALLKSAGRGRLAHVRVAVAEGSVSETEISGPGLFRVLAGILLVLPGFLTDALGLLVLLPPVQQALRAALGRVIRTRGQRHDGVVDLAPGEWDRVEDETSDRPRHDLPQPGAAQSLSHRGRCVSHAGEYGGACQALRPEDKV
jgi:UPF0716 protein FxsA